MRRLVTAVAAGCGLAIAVVIVGCGSGGESTSNLTKAEFVKKGNAICAKAESERGVLLRKEVGSSSNQFTLSEQEEFVPTFIKPYIHSADQLDQLGPPDSEADEIVALMKKSGEQATADPHKLIKAKDEIFGTVNKKASKYGLNKCRI
jgi:hypothetical protein